MSTQVLPTLPTTKPPQFEIVEDGPIRRFADSTLMADITRALAQMPEGHTVTTVAVLDWEDKSVRGVVMLKLSEGFSAMGVLEARYKDSKLSVTGQAAIMWSH